MNKERLTNYDKAKAKADEIDEKIIKTLQLGKSFIVEAGAGSGKTYSLNKVIEWIQDNRGNYYKKRRQTVICITYTNAAVEVLLSRLKDTSFIMPSTIHSFAWNAIKQFQNHLIEVVKNNEIYYPKEGDVSKITKVEYTLGHRYIEGNTLFLFHDDVISLFAELLDNVKFRNIFFINYPLILIDEYQDSFSVITDRFIKYFISQGNGPQFGFFGDSWQTIYQSQKVCGNIYNENLVRIEKGSNFRSAPKIVEMLNFIRPELPQVSAIDDFEGEVIVVTCNDFIGERRTDRGFKGDLPQEELKSRLDRLCAAAKSAYSLDEKDLKTLMLTHKVLAAQQGYDKLFKILGDKLKDKEDPLLIFLMDKVEPIMLAMRESKMSLLFEVLGVKHYPITKKSQKKQWKALLNDYESNKDKSVRDIIKIIIESGLIPVPSQVENLYDNYLNNPQKEYGAATVKDYLDIEYKQFISAITFLNPEAEFSTDHGVKGEEYDTVIFSITGGWANYQFDIYAPMIDGIVPEDKQSAYIRNRNLFYVCCSRPKRRLLIFVSLLVHEKFKDFLKKLSGEENYYNYQQYIEYIQNIAVS